MNKLHQATMGSKITLKELQRSTSQLGAPREQEELCPRTGMWLLDSLPGSFVNVLSLNAEKNLKDDNRFKKKQDPVHSSKHYGKLVGVGKNLQIPL